MKQIENMIVKTDLHQPPKLPSKVTVQLDEIETSVDVNWGPEAFQSYDQAGTYEVEGKIAIKEYENPLIEQRADPFIYKHTDGYYYFTGSYPLYDRIVLRRAKTIHDLPHAEEKVIWRKHDEGIMGAHIWAPEIHFVDGKWYIHFAAGEAEEVWAIRPYVLACQAENPLEGSWEEKGQVHTNFQSFSLDATTFEHRDKRYLVWAQKGIENDLSNLYIAEMENPWTIKGEQVLLSTPDLAWERQGHFVNEGAAVLKRNGKVFITYSGSATDHNYAMGLLTADEDSDLLDPQSWKKSPEPLLKTSEETSEYGPGHNSFTVAEDGKTDLLVYHARSYQEIEGEPLYDHNRHARVQQFFWDSEGYPYFGKPGQRFKDAERKVTATVHVNPENDEA